MKKTVLSIFLLSAFISIYGQTLQTYSGNYADGEAIYQYYENANMERIFHGNYQYNERKLKIEGRFDNNLKEGTWSYDYLNDYSYYSIESKKLVGKYVNGKMEGEWNYSYYRKNKKTNKLEESQKMTANFSNNNFIGKYSLEEENMYHSNGIKKLEITGQFNKSGLLDSTWVIKYVQNGYDFETTLKYKEGILHSAFTRNIATGDIKERKEQTDFVNQYIANFDSTSKTVKINGKYYSQFIYSITLGEWNEGSFWDYESSGVYSELKASSFIDIVSNKKFNGSREHGYKSSFISESDGAAELTSTIIFWFNLHNGEFFKIQRGSNKTAIYPKSGIRELSEKETIEIENPIIRTQVIKRADQFFEQKKYEDALAEYTKANKISESNETSKRISELEEIVRKEEIERQWKAAVDNGDKEFSTENYEKAMSFYKKAELIKPDASLISKIEKTQVKLDEIAEKAAIKRRDRDIERLISQTKNEHQSIQQNSPLINKKPKLTKIYRAFYDDIQTKVEGCSLDEKLIYLKKLDKFQSNLINLVTYQQTDNFEKQAKRVKDANEIWALLVKNTSGIDWEIK